MDKPSLIKRIQEIEGLTPKPLMKKFSPQGKTCLHRLRSKPITFITIGRTEIWTD